jgi:hypothetical protein
MDWQQYANCSDKPTCISSTYPFPNVKFPNNLPKESQKCFGKRTCINMATNSFINENQKLMSLKF